MMRKLGRSSFSNLVQRRLSEILLLDSKDPRFKKVTISRVEAAPNMSSARVFISVFPTEGKEELIETLNNASGFFSRELGKVLHTRNTPRLIFIYDSGFDFSDEIEKLLRDNLPEKNIAEEEMELPQDTEENPAN